MDDHYVVEFPDNQENRRQDLAIREMINVTMHVDDPLSNFGSDDEMSDSERRFEPDEMDVGPPSDESQIPSSSIPTRASRGGVPKAVCTNSDDDPDTTIRRRSASAIERSGSRDILAQDPGAAIAMRRATSIDSSDQRVVSSSTGDKAATVTGRRGSADSTGDEIPLAAGISSAHSSISSPSTDTTDCPHPSSPTYNVDGLYDISLAYVVNGYTEYIQKSLNAKVNDQTRESDSKNITGEKEKNESSSEEFQEFQNLNDLMMPEVVISPAEEEPNECVIHEKSPAKTFPKEDDEEIKDHFVSLNQLMDAMEARAEAMEVRAEAMKGRLQNMEARMGIMEARNESKELLVESILLQFDSMTSRLKSLEAKRNSHEVCKYPTFTSITDVSVDENFLSNLTKKAMHTHEIEEMSKDASQSISLKQRGRVDQVHPGFNVKLNPRTLHERDVACLKQLLNLESGEPCDNESKTSDSLNVQI